MTTLSLDNHKLTEEKTEELLERLPEGLCLRFCTLNAASWRKVYASVHALQHLSLLGNELPSVDVLAEFVATSQTIRSLTLGNCNLGDEQVEFFARAARKNLMLEELRFPFNHITCLGAFYLARVMRTHPSMRVVDVWANHVKEWGVEALVEAFVKSPNMVELDVDDNYLALSQLTLSKAICAKAAHDRAVGALWGGETFWGRNDGDGAVRWRVEGFLCD